MNPMTFWNSGDQFLILAANVLIQVTLLTGIALAIATAARRNPAARYGVLWTTLLLVLLTPALTLVMQTSGHGLLSVSLMVSDSRDDGGPRQTVAGMEPAPVTSASAERQELPSTPRAAPEIPMGAIDPIDPDSFSEPPVSIDSAGSAPRLASRATLEELNAAESGSSPTATPAGKVLRAAMPPLLLIWIVGAVVLLVRLAIAWWRLVALVRAAEPVVNRSSPAILKQVCRDLGLVRAPDLVQSLHVTGPVSTGFLRPRVVLPEWMAERVTDEQLRAILTHEAAHILRRDQVAVLLQNISMAVFWLHPLVRVLNRRLALAREEICDNYVLFAADAPSYSRTLLELAQLIQPPGPLAGTVGLFTSRWKLDLRVAGLLDESRSRTTSLTSRGRAFIVVLGAILLTVATCGTMTLAVGPTGKSVDLVADPTEASAAVAEGENEPAVVAETDERADQERSENDTHTGRPDEGAATNAPDSDLDDRIVVGHVVDDNGNSIDGATVVLPINFGFGGKPRDVAQGITNADGVFRLEVPADWLEPPLWHHLTTLWAYKAGFALGTANVRPQLEEDGGGDDLEIALPPESNPEFTILDETGNPAVSVVVEPQHYREPRGYGIVPQELLGHLAAESDADGHVTIRGIEQGKLFKLLARSVRHGTQEFRVDALPNGGELQLREAVSLKGRVIRGDPEWRRNIRLYFTTESPRRSTPPLYGINDAVGTAAVTTDEEGRFEIPLIATGNLRIEEALDTQLPVRLLLPERETVPVEGDLILPLMTATNVQGRVVRKDGRTPVAGVTVSIRYGQYRQGDRAVSDENGEFEARVLPGPVYQAVISIPDPDLTSVGTASSQKFDVPITDEVFNLPAIELVGTSRQTGRLVDADGDPLANYDVWGVDGNRRYGFARTNDQGEFEMKLPNGTEIERYGYSSPDDVLGRATIDEAEPLTLRAE